MSKSVQWERSVFWDDSGATSSTDAIAESRDVVPCGTDLSATCDWCLLDRDEKFKVACRGILFVKNGI